MAPSVSKIVGLLLLWPAMCTLTSGRASAGVITIDTPGQNGAVVVQAFTQRQTVFFGDGTYIQKTIGPDTGDITVNAGMAIADKAKKVADAVGKLPNVTTAKVNGNTVEVTGKFIGIKVSDSSAEPKGSYKNNKVGDPPGMSWTAFVGFSGSLSGVDANGAEAVYQASLGDNDFTTMSNLPYSTILADSMRTGMSLLDTLVVDTYDMLKSDLSSSLQSDLYIDLPDHEIAFLFLSTPLDPFAGDYASDTTTVSSYGVGLTTVIPEPSTLALTAVGLLGLTLLVRRQRTLFA